MMYFCSFGINQTDSMRQKACTAFLSLWLVASAGGRWFDLDTILLGPYM